MPFTYMPHRKRNQTRIVRATLRRWLALHAPDEIVGRACNTNRCPVANFVRQTRNAQDVQVMTNGFVEYLSPDGESLYETRSPFVRLYNQALDASVRHRINEPIRARDALAIFDVVDAQISRDDEIREQANSLPS